MRFMENIQLMVQYYGDLYDFLMMVIKICNTNEMKEIWIAKEIVHQRNLHFFSE